jgi:hypothetical protein
MNMMRPVNALLDFLNRWRPVLHEALLTSAVAGLAIVWIASLYSGYPKGARVPQRTVAFFPIAIRPPGTTDAVVQYTVELGREVSNLREKRQNVPDRGYLDYVPNQTMTQGVKERVVAVISLSKSDLERVRDSVFKSSHGTVDTNEISVSSTMTAKLTGSSSLQIQELSTQEQLIQAGDPTIWNWDVIPTEDGDAQLYLILSVRGRSADGLPSAKDQEPRIRTIHVRVNRAFKFQKFFKDNLAAIVGILSIATTATTLPWRKCWTWLSALSVIKSIRFRLRWLIRKRRRPKTSEPPNGVS